MTSPPPLWSIRSTRLKICLALCLAIYASVSMRTALSMGIVCMVNSTAFEDTTNHAETNSSFPLDSCPVSNEKGSTASGDYGGSILWSPSRKSTLFSATYYGSLTTMLFSGPLADKYGPKRILAGAISLFVVMTLAAPSLARLDYWAYYASRVVMGMGDGFVLPCANALGVRWFPSNEKSTMSALYTSGIQIATGSSNLIGAFLCKVPLLEGWPLIFYLFASIGLIWLVLWLLFVTDYPSQHKFIGEKERKYLEQRVVNKRTTKHSIPWRKILTSREVYACIFVNMTTSFLVSVNQNYLPLYFKEELRIPISMNGLFTMTPFLTQLIFKNVLARVADHLKSSEKLSPTAAVKLFQSICSFGSCIAILCLAVLPSCHQPWIAVVALIVYSIAFAGNTSGFGTSLLCIAPAYTGTLFSISMGCGQLASVFATYVVGAVTQFGLPHKWLIVFSIGSFIQIFSGVFFLLYGSGEPAEWAKPTSSEENKKPEDEILLGTLPSKISRVTGA